MLTILRRVEAGVWEMAGGEVVDFETGRVADLERRKRVRALAGLATTRFAVDNVAKLRADAMGGRKKS